MASKDMGGNRGATNGKSSGGGGKVINIKTKQTVTSSKASQLNPKGVKRVVDATRRTKLQQDLARQLKADRGRAKALRDKNRSK